jgi:signal peptidase I
MDAEIKNCERYTWWQTAIIIVLLLVFLFVAWIVIGLAVPNPFYKMYYLTSGSMNPTIHAGDVICLEPIKEDSDLEVGNIITFVYKGSLTTHRIADITSDGRIYTKGDANNTIDSFEDNWALTKSKVVGRYVMRVPLVGYVISFIKGTFGSGAYISEKVSISGNMISIALPTPEPGPSMMAPLPVPPPEGGIPSPTPELSPIPELSPAPEPSSSPELSPTPEPSSSPELSPTSEPNSTPEPSFTSEPDPTPKPSPSSEPSSTPETTPALAETS